MKRWFEIPKFLWKSESEWPTQVSVDVDGSDPGVKATLNVNFQSKNWILLIFKAWSKVLKLTKIGKSSGNNSTANANPTDASWVEIISNNKGAS